LRTGDEAIDQDFVLEGAPDEPIRHLFLKGISRNQLLRAKELYAELEGKTLSEYHIGLDSDPDNRQFLMDLISDLADAIEKLPGKGEA
jgi:hypothetical protein